MIRLNPLLEIAEAAYFHCPCGNILPHDSAFIGRRIYCRKCHHAVIMPHAPFWTHLEEPNLAAVYPEPQEAVAIMSATRRRRRRRNKQRMVEEWILAGKIMLSIATVGMLTILYITAGRL